MDEPAPPGYYYQPPGGGYAQYIGQSVSSNFQLPPMAPHYQDPNDPSPMPGFYHIDSFGNPPQYLGVNPPRRERGIQNKKQGNQIQKQKISSSSTETHRSRGSNRSKGTYVEYGYIRTDENPEGECYFSYTDSTGVTHYLVPDNQDTPPSRIRPTNESFPSYIPPQNTQSQGYEGRQNNQRYRTENKDKPPPRIKPTNESSPSMDYIPPFNTRTQGYGGVKNNQMYDTESRFSTESRDSYQWPRQGDTQKHPGVSSHDRKILDQRSPQKNYAQEDFPSNSAREAYYTSSGLERAPNQQAQYVSRDQGLIQSQSHISRPGAQPHAHGSEHGSGQILYSVSNYNTQPSAINTQQVSTHGFSQNVPPNTSSRRDVSQNHERGFDAQGHGHSHGGIRFGQ